MAEQLDLFRRPRFWLVRTIEHNRAKAPDGSGHLYELETAEEVNLEHERRRASGRFPWLGFAISVTEEP
jgi:hypothetical protein